MKTHDDGWLVCRALHGRVRVGALGCVALFLSGMASGIAWVTIFEDFDYESDGMCLNDELPPREGSWLMATVRAWQRRSRALEEVANNPFTVMADDGIALAAYHQRTGVWRSLIAIVGTIGSAAVTAKLSS